MDGQRTFVVLIPALIINRSSSILTRWLLNVILFGVQTLFICILSIVILNVKTKPSS
jgi:hypothetical protein